MRGNSANTYVPQYVPNNLPQYECSGLMTWYNQGKCADFLRNTNRHFSETKIVNFDIIHRQCCGKVVPSELFKHYQTVSEKTVSNYPSTTQTEIRSSAFGTDRKNIFLRMKQLKSIQKNTQQKMKTPSAFKLFLIFLINLD